MITYDLRCSAAHIFEGWFASSADFDNQVAAGLLRCPYCDDIAIAKQLCAPNIGRKGNQTRVTAKNIGKSVVADHVEKSESSGWHSSNTASSSKSGIANSIPAAALNAPDAMIEKLAMMQADILKDSRWVGRKFADEARAMHYGEAAAQQIHGESSPKEAKALAEEGIAIAALPFPVVPPDAKN